MRIIQENLDLLRDAGMGRLDPFESGVLNALLAEHADDVAECVRLRAELAELKAEAALNEEGWRRELAELRTAAQAALNDGHHQRRKWSGTTWTNRDPHHHNTLSALAELLERGNQ